VQLRSAGRWSTPHLHSELYEGIAPDRQALRLRISDTIPKAFWMYEDETPVHPVFETRVEATSWFVVEPIARL